MPGAVQLKASYLGYEAMQKDATVVASQAITIEFRLQPTVAKKEKEVLITAERPLVEVSKASTTRSFNSEELKNLTIDPTLDSVVEQQPGVTRDNNQIHIRGGRSEETLFIVDGVQMRDVLSGDSEGKNVSARSVAEVNIITGGFDAKYGQALSGIVEAKLKEGGETYQGYVGMQTDELWDGWNTRQVDFQIGGPLPLADRWLAPLAGRGSSRPTFFLNVASDISDGYLPSIRDLPGDYHLQSAYQDRLFGKKFDYGRFFTPGADNDWRLLWKSAWKASTNHKFVFSATKALSFNQGFSDIDVSETNRNKINYPWAWSQLLQRYSTVTNDQNSMVLSWTHTARAHLFHTVKATRYFSARHTSVDGKLWDKLDPSVFVDASGNEGSLYFVSDRSASDFRIRSTRTWALDWDWQYKSPRHDVQWGGRAQYEDVS
ncbi:MAG: Plug domain-containing protein, partial [Candidatus Eisenbacteria bacterium]